MGDFLNLVFEDWYDDNTPKPNCLHINENMGYDIMVLPQFIMEKNNFYNVNKCRLNEVSVDADYYYVINHMCEYDFLFSGKLWVITKKIEDLIRNKNLKIIFLSQHESYMNLEYDVRVLQNLIKFKNLNEKNFYLINNNSLIPHIKRTTGTNINLFKCDFLTELTSDLSIVMKDNVIIDEKKFLFLCHNRRPKTHRLAILTLLKHGNLLNDDMMDWSLTYGTMSHPDLIVFENQNFIEEFDFLKEDYNQICLTKKLSYYEQTKDWFNNPDDYQHWKHIDMLSYHQSYINIVTESHYEIPDIHMTEKTFKPFYFFQMPIFVSSHSHVNQIKLEHELFLFDDLIDHSYDNEIDNKKRIIKVFDEIKRLSGIRNEVELYYKSNKEKLISNHNYIKNFRDKQKTFKYFNNLSDKKRLI
jgi:hypothetical protein